MTDFQSLMAFARDTVTAPRQAARQLLDKGYSDPVRMMGFALVVVLTTLIGHIAVLLMPVDLMGAGGPNPLQTAALQAGLMIGSAALAFVLGRWAGGAGQFRDALLLLIWMQFILILAQVAQIVVQVLLPPLTIVVAVASIALFFYLLSNFIAELHGFRSAGMTFLAIVGVMIALSFVLAALFGPYLVGAGV